jgi:hypothetical protein
MAISPDDVLNLDTTVLLLVQFRTGVVMIAIFSDVSQFSAKMAFFVKTNVIILFVYIN